jgi:ATPase subunit of ABC transporter with duplicated ATPase domains
VVSAVVWPCAACCCKRRTSCCWTNPPTTWTPRAWPGWSTTCGYKGTVIAITHDRYFLDNVAGWILELDRGEGIPYKGNYTNWLEQKTARLAQEEKTESKRNRILKQELEWVRSNAKARRTKSKARLENYEKMQSESVKEKEAKLEIYIPNGQRLGDKVIEFKGVTKAFGDRVLFETSASACRPQASWASSAPTVRVRPPCSA